ncbi:12284_t:CDS:1 [Racocetra persica]|uniref:12284_t:CDS:1 n=1 Tax=Racocetra persica TaxID=160502 RepID=A0ACA9PRH1_9GLOM|nr:12284_t:CDS:1 [Racocetra persica]
MLYNEEKLAKKELKELQDKKNEWIRVEKENEPKNHKTIEKLGQEVEDVRAENRKLDLSYIDFYQKEMNKQEPEATKQRKDIKTDEKINGKTIEEVLGKD